MIATFNLMLLKVFYLPCLTFSGNIHHICLRNRVWVENMVGRLLLQIQRMEGAAQICPQAIMYFR